MAPLRILVVEDHPDSREMLCELLELYGVAVLAAAAVNEALALIEASAPDVILSDLGMPHEDGYDLARRLQEHPNRKGIRLVAVTGYTGQAEHELALQAGYDRVLTKPLLPEQVEELLKEVRRP